MKYFKSCCGLARVAVEAIKLNSLLLHIKILNAPKFSVCVSHIHSNMDYCFWTLQVAQHLCPNICVPWTDRSVLS